MNKQDIPHCEIVRRFNYEPQTGSFTWRTGQRSGHEVGCVVTNKAGNSYRMCSIGYKGKTYNFMTHVLILFHQKGEWPVEVDHEDGNGLNNSWKNLRSVTRSVNNMNHRKQRNNSSGIAGVSYILNKRKWRAFGSSGGKQKHLLLSPDFFEVVCARKRWELTRAFTERHGI